jgi:hypothetical protein
VKCMCCGCSGHKSRQCRSQSTKKNLKLPPPPSPPLHDPIGFPLSYDQPWRCRGTMQLIPKRPQWWLHRFSDMCHGRRAISPVHSRSGSMAWSKPSDGRHQDHKKAIYYRLAPIARYLSHEATLWTSSSTSSTTTTAMKLWH